MPDKTSRRKLAIIDGNSLAYRGYYAMRHLSTADGQSTHAIYAFTMMLLRLLEEDRPDVIAVAFDGPAKTFRHDAFDGYKAHRKPTPDDLRSQMPIVREVVDAFGIPVLEAEGFEADDLVGTMAREAVEEGYDAIIVTGDLDALQLVNSGVRVMTTIKGVTDTVIYDERAVVDRYGLKPAQITDFKALKGDTSDNIPGVPGVGDKTAVKLLQQFENVESMLERVDEIADPKLRDKILGSSGQITMSKHLATIITDLPLDTPVSQMSPPAPDYARLADLFTRLEFKTLLRRLPKQEQEAPKSVLSAELGEYRIVESASDLQAFLACFSEKRAFSVRVHTTTRRIMDSCIAGIVLSAGKGDTTYVRVVSDLPCDSGELDFGLSEYRVPLQELKAILGTSGIAKYGHNIKNDYGVLKRNGIILQGLAFDSLLAAYVLNPGRSRYDVYDVALERLGLDIPQIDKKNKAASSESEEIRVACAEAEAAYLLAPALKQELDDSALLDLLNHVEMPLVCTLADMELRGVAVDMAWLGRLSAELEGRIRQIEQDIYGMAGLEFNIGSTKQLQSVLFDKLLLPAGKKTKTGLSTGAETLEALAPMYPIVSKILEYRELTKLKSTYADALPRLADQATGRIHTSLNQAVTATGRLSSSEPNLQNIPIRTEIGREIRKAFVAANGNLLVSADYSQIELRILAHITQDPEMLRAFRNDEDIHTHTACTLFGVGPEEVSTEMRRRAKTINFAVIYGMSDFGLSTELGIHPREAKQYISEYFGKFPGVLTYTKDTLARARETGYVYTLLGRRRYVSEIFSSNHNYRMSGERAAVNMPIQGTAADIMKLAMVEMDRRLNTKGFATEMVLQVHDELVFEVPPAELPEVAPMIRSVMENAFALDVELKVDVKVGANWCEMEPFSG